MKARELSLIRMTPPVIANRGLLFSSGATVPTDGTDGYQTGCIFQHTDGSAETAFYINEGSITSCDFNAVVPAGSAELSDLSDVGTLAYTAGKVLVADGDSYEEVAVSSHATLSSAGALTLATVTKTFAIALSDLRCEDAAQTLLPATPDGDGGTLGLGAGAGSPVLGTSTNNADATESAMFDFVIPEDYVADGDIVVRVKAYMSAASNAQSDYDVVAKLIKGGALDATDLCETGPIDAKAVVAVANHDFTIQGDAAGDLLIPGAIVNVAIALQRDDTGGSTAGTVICDGIDVLVPCYR
ncbi:MAG: hypothetical protein GY906_23990 [bacterium]|nr:hypothetical protein [bacterium]